MNGELIYRQPDPVTPEAAVEVFRSRDVARIPITLVGLALYGEHYEFTLLWCMYFLSHSNEDVAGIAATCIGHLARIHGWVNKQAVVPALEMAVERGLGEASDALQDIAHFCAVPEMMDGESLD